MGKLFGTDGIRGVANCELTPELAVQLGRAAAYLLCQQEQRPAVIVGKDTRRSGDMLEAGLTAGLCSAGADVWRMGVLPTPAVIWLTRHLAAAAGVVISASHNPADDNGIKFCSNDGYKLSVALEESIENCLHHHPDIPYPRGAAVGRVVDKGGAIEAYLDHVRRTVDVGLDGLRVIVDCANGAAGATTPRVLSELGARVTVINASPDGLNINAGCGSLYPESLQQAVLTQGADVGLAHDGDADRLIAVDASGAIVDGDKIIGICALYLHRHGSLPGPTVVTTVMSNWGLYQTLRQAGITVVQTPVGDRYVLEEMQARGAILGGEQSGHIIFLAHHTTGDGLITALQLLQVMVKTGKTLQELAASIPCFPQIIRNVPTGKREQVMEDSRFWQVVEEARRRLDGRGRVVVRPSGTEPVIRLMAEGPDEDELHAVVALLAEAAGQVTTEREVGSDLVIPIFQRRSPATEAGAN